MSLILNAVCNNCAFEKVVKFGSGMIQHFDHPELLIPAFNKKTGELITRNFYDGSDKTNLAFYTQPEMYKGDTDEEFHQWDDLKLSVRNNFSPSCKRFEMIFELDIFSD